MLATTASDAGNYAGYLLAIGAAIAYFLDRRNKQSKDDLVVTVVELQARDSLNQGKIRDLEAAAAVSEVEIANLKNSVATLDKARSGIDVMMVGFAALGVDKESLVRAANSRE